jgi:xanthine dehydrogenase accessory factor
LEFSHVATSDPHNIAMDAFFLELSERLTQEAFVLVRVTHTEGSAPREVGALMAVGTEASRPIIGTIGGGHLEWQAIIRAGSLLSSGTPHEVVRYTLGPTLGQCCGGAVELCFEQLSRGSTWPARAAAALKAGETFELPTEHSPYTLAPAPLHVSLFGGGHVGAAIVQVLALLPCRVLWVDSRDAVLPVVSAPNVRTEHSAPIQAEVAHLPSGSHVLIMSFSHAEDLEIVAACLRRLRTQNDLPFIGLIGSRTKWVTFQRRLAEKGFSAAELARVTCPIGVHGLIGKEPQVIAVSVAAQLLALHGSAG